MRFAPLFPGLAAMVLTSATAFAVPPPAPPPPAPPPTGDVSVPSDRVLTTTLPDGVVVTFEPGSTGRWGGEGKLASETAKWTRGFHLELTDGEIDITMPVAAKGEHAF